MTMASAPLSHACRTSAAWAPTAFITLTAIIPCPPANAFAARTSRSSATRLACSMAAWSRLGVAAIEVGVMMAQVDAGDGAHGVVAGHGAGQPVCGNAARPCRPAR